MVLKTKLSNKTHLLWTQIHLKGKFQGETRLWLVYRWRTSLVWRKVCFYFSLADLAACVDRTLDIYDFATDLLFLGFTSFLSSIVQRDHTRIVGVYGTTLVSFPSGIDERKTSECLDSKLAQPFFHLFFHCYKCLKMCETKLFFN